MPTQPPQAGTLWLDHRTGIWQWSIQREGQRRTRSTRTTSRRLALRTANQWAEAFARRRHEDLLETMTAALSRSRATRPGHLLEPRCPIADAWTRYPATTTSRGPERPLAPSTIAELHGHIRALVHWLPSHDPTVHYLDEITTAHATSFRAHLLTHTGGRRATTILGSCRLLLERAGVLPNPFHGLRAAASPPAQRRPFTDAELHTILATAAPPLRLLLLLLIYTGQRLGDCAQFQWSAIDPTLSGLTTIPAKTRHLAEPIYIPLHPALQTALAATPHEQRHGPILPDYAAAYQRSRTNLSRLVCTHLRVAGIPTSIPGPNGRPVPVTGAHAFRHTTCTWLAEANVPEAVARQLLGHHSDLVHRIYVHIRRHATTQAIHSLPNL